MFRGQAAGGGAPGFWQTVPGPGRAPRVSSVLVLYLVWSAPVNEEKEITFEALAPPAMTPELAVALAQLIRAALARRTERSERAA